VDTVVSRRTALARLGSAAAAVALGSEVTLAQPRPGGHRPAAGPRRGPVSGPGPAPDPAFAALARRHGFEPDGPGLTAMTVRPPGRPSIHCFGLADLEAKTPMAPRTIFELASVSKTITSTATLMLCEKNVLSLNDDVRKHIPELPVYDETRPVRIEGLLRHTSGLPDYMGLGEVSGRNGEYAGNDDYIPEFARQKESAPLAFPTGRKHVYNNTNFMLLATVIGRASKKGYAAFLRENIFAPAAMKDAFVYDSPAAVPEGASEQAAVGYVKEGEVWRAAWGLPPGRKETLLTVGDGGIWVSIRDMAAWDAALHTGKLISRETAKRAATPTKTPDGESHGYGLGWALYFGDDGATWGYGHNGGWGGFVTTYCHEPEGNLGTSILSNRGDFDIDKFWFEMRDLMKRGRLGR